MKKRRMRASNIKNQGSKDRHTDIEKTYRQAARRAGRQVDGQKDQHNAEGKQFHIKLGEQATRTSKTKNGPFILSFPARSLLSSKVDFLPCDR